jgi:hypothetical protein
LVSRTDWNWEPAIRTIIVRIVVFSCNGGGLASEGNGVRRGGVITGRVKFWGALVAGARAKAVFVDGNEALVSGAVEFCCAKTKESFVGGAEVVTSVGALVDAALDVVTVVVGATVVAVMAAIDDAAVLADAEEVTWVAVDVVVSVVVAVVSEVDAGLVLSSEVLLPTTAEFGGTSVEAFAAGIEVISAVGALIDAVLNAEAVGAAVAVVVVTVVVVVEFVLDAVEIGAKVVGLEPV